MSHFGIPPNSNFDVSRNSPSKLHVSHQVALVHSLRQSVFLHIYIAFLDILHKGQPFSRIPYMGKLLVLNFNDQRYNPFFQWLPYHKFLCLIFES